jgi:hypothetical protein
MGGAGWREGGRRGEGMEIKRRKEEKKKKIA